MITAIFVVQQVDSNQYWLVSCRQKVDDGKHHEQCCSNGRFPAVVVEEYHRVEDEGCYEDNWEYRSKHVVQSSAHIAIYP